jgi:hypothetical protein
VFIFLSRIFSNLEFQSLVNSNPYNNSSNVLVL